jgi:hypothetical protein
MQRAIPIVNLANIDYRIYLDEISFLMVSVQDMSDLEPYERVMKLLIAEFKSMMKRIDNNYRYILIPSITFMIECIRSINFIQCKSNLIGSLNAIIYKLHQFHKFKKEVSIIMKSGLSLEIINQLLSNVIEYTSPNHDHICRLVNRIDELIKYQSLPSINPKQLSEIQNLTLRISIMESSLHEMKEVISTCRVDCIGIEDESSE